MNLTQRRKVTISRGKYYVPENDMANYIQNGHHTLPEKMPCSPQFPQELHLLVCLLLDISQSLLLEY